MHRRALSTFAPVMLAIVFVVCGCGGSNDNGGFEHCGNGVLDSGEQCDDGNLIDTDACLSTCQFNVCGDGVINTGVEQCDRHQFGSATCATFGFAGGSLSCTEQCTIDTSGCSGTSPEPTSTPAGTPVATASSAATPTTNVATPSTAPTPSGGRCGAGDAVVVVVSLSQPYAGAQIDLAYPSGSVNIPGTGSAATVTARVAFAATDGLTAINDHSSNGSGVDDTLTASVVSSSDHAAGPFVTVTFDCIADQPPPTAASFSCNVGSASTSTGDPIANETCSVATQ